MAQADGRAVTHEGRGGIGWRVGRSVALVALPELFVTELAMDISTYPPGYLVGMIRYRRTSNRVLYNHSSSRRGLGTEDIEDQG